MKKILIALSLIVELAGVADAQTIKKKEPAAPTDNAAPKKGIIINKKADGTPDKRFKLNKGLKKDGTNDLRFARSKKKGA